MVAPYAQREIEIELSTELNSKPYVDMTISVMKDFGVRVRRDGYHSFCIPLTHYELRNTSYPIESDASAASYFFAAPAICGGTVKVENISRKSVQGDIAFLDVLQQMGCTVEETENSISVTGAAELHGIDVDMCDISDTAQTLAVIAPFASSPTRIRGIASARVKETDRVSATCTELKRLGVQVDEHEDGMTIYPCRTFKPANVQTYNDHRMAMAFSLIGLYFDGVTIENPSCVSKTFPNYFEVLELPLPAGEGRGEGVMIFHLGLIGYPVSHSLSPNIQNAALKACGLEGDYSLFPIAPDDMQGLKNLLDHVRSGEITGLNVTIPHKQNVIQFMDELALTAKAIGAVNIIYMRDNKLIGDNTDAPGFLKDLKSKFLSFNLRPSALILGAGGSARAVVYALLNDGWTVTIAARRIEQAQQLALSFTNYELGITNFNDLRPSTFDLIVNTTPVGMTPNVDQSPLPDNITLSQDTRIYDLVYNPRETKLVRDARLQGLQATTGLGMLIEQAALGFELWTGHKPSRRTLRLSVK